MCAIVQRTTHRSRISISRSTPAPAGGIWVNMSTLGHEDPKSGRRRIVHMARSVEDRKQTEAVVQRMLVVSKQLAEISEHSLRPAPVDTLSEQEHRVLRSFSKERARPTSCASSNQPPDAPKPPSSHQSEARHARSSGSRDACDSPETDLGRCRPPISARACISGELRLFTAGMPIGSTWPCSDVRTT